MAGYDLLLQIETILGECHNPTNVEQFSMGILNVAGFAYPACTAAYGPFDSRWYPDYQRHFSNAWNADFNCSVLADNIAARCPLTTTTVTVDSDMGPCHKHESITQYLHQCQNADDVAYCQAYFGYSTVQLDRSVCTKHLTVVESLCAVSPNAVLVPEAPQGCSAVLSCDGTTYTIACVGAPFETDLFVQTVSNGPFQQVAQAMGQSGQFPALTYPAASPPVAFEVCYRNSGGRTCSGPLTPVNASCAPPDTGQGGGGGGGGGGVAPGGRKLPPIHTQM